MIVEQISKELGLSRAYLLKLARTASHRYKAYTIPKKSGKGERLIQHPARELKLIQRWLVKRLLGQLPVHKSATAYKPGSSIRANAARHVKNNFLLRVDFRDFFLSLTSADVTAVLRANRSKLFGFRLSAEDVRFISAIVSRNNRLVIGAPSSPALSNAIMFEFDEYWSNRCSELNVAYSRYADDLYFSTNVPKVLSDVLYLLRAYLPQQLFPKLSINDDKTVFTSRKRRRMVTGLVLTSDKRVSLGRSKKRFIKSLVYRLVSGQLRHDGEDTESVRNRLLQLGGLIAFSRSVEPSFVASLERKYAADIRTRLMLAMQEFK